MRLWHVIWRASTFGLLSFAGALAGCSPNKVTATAWTASPDGHWLARIAKYDTAGPGVNSLYETVQLKPEAARKSVEVFLLDEGEMTGEQLGRGPVITLVWHDPHHLEISHRAGVVLHRLSQVADVTVSTRE